MKSTRFLCGVLAGAAIFAMAMPAAAAPAKFTDRNEYDLVLTIRAEAATQKRLVLLDQWKAKYPKTELLQVRQELYFSAYQSLGDNVHMLSVARANLDAEITYSSEDSPSKPIPSKGGRKRLQRGGRPNVPKTFGSRAR